MQLPHDEQEFIHCALYVEGKAIHQIEREAGHSRQAIRRVIMKWQEKPNLLLQIPQGTHRLQLYCGREYPQNDLS